MLKVTDQDGPISIQYLLSLKNFCLLLLLSIFVPSSTMQYYVWYPVSFASMLPVIEITTGKGGAAKRVEEAWSNLLLFDPAVGVQSGFYDPNDQTLYRHNEEYDIDDECYDWVYEAFPEATHFMAITLPDDLEATNKKLSVRPIPSWLLGAGGLSN